MQYLTHSAFQQDYTLLGGLIDHSSVIETIVVRVCHQFILFCVLHIYLFWLSERHTNLFIVLVTQSLYILSRFTFLANIKPVGLWRTFHTTPPFPAPNSPSFSKSSGVSSPTFCFCVKNSSNLFLCWSSKSNSLSFSWRTSRFAPPVLFLLKHNKINHCKSI